MSRLSTRIVGFWNNLKYYKYIAGYQGLLTALISGFTKKPRLARIIRNDLKFPIYLRIPSSDLPVYEQIFVLKHYAFDVLNHPTTIVDAGANIGLTSIYFAARFPKAKIIAIEPEESNYRVLEKNIAPYHNIIPIQGALWDRNEEIDLIDPGLGYWGFMTKGGDGSGKAKTTVCHRVKGMTVDHLMSEQGIKFIDLLKVDIEGSEKEVFHEPSHWIDKVGNIIVEIHEDMKTGCTDSVDNATKAFAKKWFYGENVYMARDNSGIQIQQQALPVQIKQLSQQRL